MFLLTPHRAIVTLTIVACFMCAPTALALEYAETPTVISAALRTIRAQSYLPSAGGEVAGAVATTTTSATSPLSDDDLITLGFPATVRLLSHIYGTTTLPNFAVDPKTLAVTPTSAKTKPNAIPVNELLTGTGFFISPAGYLVTNAHVVTGEVLAVYIVADNIEDMILDWYKKLTPAEKKMVDAKSESDGIDLGLRLIEYMRKNMTNTFAVEVVALPVKDASAVALDAEIKSDYSERVRMRVKALDIVREAFVSGTPATIIAANRNFLDDGRDVAVLKIHATGLPSLALDAMTEPKAGTRVSVVGYPGNADISTLDRIATYTKGSITAVKDSPNKQFRFIQTDAKISKGSSGGPLLNDRGQVIGIVTQESGGDEGDNFAAAIPISIAVSMLSTAGVALPSTGTYASHASKGLELASAGNCTEALAELRAAREYTSDFGTMNGHLAERIAHCEIAAVAEVKAKEDAINEKEAIAARERLITFVLVGVGVVALGGAVVMFMRRRHRRAMLHTPVYVPPSSRPPLDPSIEKYVSDMRAQSAADGQIAAALKSSGWSDALIARALAEVR